MLTANPTTKSWRKDDVTVLSLLIPSKSQNESVKITFLFFVSIMKLDINYIRINFNLPNDTYSDNEVTESTETQWSLQH